MNTLKYFIELEMERRHIKANDISTSFKTHLEDLANMRYQDFKSDVLQIFTPYEIALIEDIGHQYRQKKLSKSMLYPTYLKRKLELLSLLLQDPHIEIGQLEHPVTPSPVTIIMSFKFELALTLDFEILNSDQSIETFFFGKGKLKEKIAVLKHIIEHATINKHTIRIAQWTLNN